MVSFINRNDVLMYYMYSVLILSRITNSTFKCRDTVCRKHQLNHDNYIGIWLRTSTVFFYADMLPLIR
jgi:hypothetical protein